VYHLGICIVSAQFGLTLDNHFWLYVPFLLGGFSPAIASFIVLKRNNEIKGFKEWIKMFLRSEVPYIFTFL
jgi:hypothetical protein